MKRVLYLLAVSPHTRTDRAAVVDAAGRDDALLLHQDGVLGLLAPTDLVDRLRGRGVRVVACAPDCRARGLSPPVDAVEWAGFVKLLEEYDLVVS